MNITYILSGIKPYHDHGVGKNSLLFRSLVKMVLSNGTQREILMRIVKRAGKKIYDFFMDSVISRAVSEKPYLFAILQKIKLVHTCMSNKRQT